MSNRKAVEILLIEDNPTDQELTLRALRQANLANNLRVAKDGVEALEFLFCEGGEHAGRSVEDAPKIILLDLGLPRADGLEVLRRIKEDSRLKNTPVIVLTSSKEEKDLVESYNLGVNSYIVKPVDFKQFAEIVKTLGRYWLLLNQAQTARPNE